MKADVLNTIYSWCCRELGQGIRFEVYKQVTFLYHRQTYHHDFDTQTPALFTQMNTYVVIFFTGAEDKTTIVSPYSVQHWVIWRLTSTLDEAEEPISWKAKNFKFNWTR